MKDLNELIKKHYRERLNFESLMEMIEEQMSSISVLVEKGEGIKTEAPSKEFVLSLPEFRLSEKMWGKEGTRDREIIQTLLGKIVRKGRTLTD